MHPWITLIYLPAVGHFPVYFLTECVCVDICLGKFAIFLEKFLVFSINKKFVHRDFVFENIFVGLQFTI